MCLFRPCGTPNVSRHPDLMSHLQKTQESPSCPFCAFSPEKCSLFQIIKSKLFLRCLFLSCCQKLEPGKINDFLPAQNSLLFQVGFSQLCPPALSSEQTCKVHHVCMSPWLYMPLSIQSTFKKIKVHPPPPIHFFPNCLIFLPTLTMGPSPSP